MSLRLVLQVEKHKANFFLRIPNVGYAHNPI